MLKRKERSCTFIGDFSRKTKDAWITYCWWRLVRRRHCLTSQLIDAAGGSFRLPVNTGICIRIIILKCPYSDNGKIFCTNDGFMENATMLKKCGTCEYCCLLVRDVVKPCSNEQCNDDSKESVAGVNFQEGNKMLLWNVGILLEVFTASRPKRR